MKKVRKPRENRRKWTENRDSGAVEKVPSILYNNHHTWENRGQLPIILLDIALRRR